MNSAYVAYGLIGLSFFWPLQSKKDIGARACFFVAGVLLLVYK